MSDLDLEEDVLISTSIAKLRDIAAEDTEECQDVVETCHGELKVPEPPNTLAVVSTVNEIDETCVKDTHGGSGNENTSVKGLLIEKEEALAVKKEAFDASTIKVKDRRIANTPKGKAIANKPKGKVIANKTKGKTIANKPSGKDVANKHKAKEVANKTKGKDIANKNKAKNIANQNKSDINKSEQAKSKSKQKRKSKSVCCCCCRRTSLDEDSRELEDRNGIRLALYNDTLEEIDPEKTIPEIKTFQQDAVETKVETRRQKCGRKCLKCCKQFLTFLFSNVGLCAAVVAYSILGGVIFQRLEAPNEIQKRHYIASLRKGFAKDLWLLVDDNRYILFEDNFTHEADKILKSYQNEVLEAKKNGWDGAESEGDIEIEPQWSFAGSLLYSVTVITTIGYGHIAPKTVNGRLVTIFYALFGIPLTLLCLANMGGFLGNGFRLFYKHTCRLCTWLCCPPQESFSQKKSPLSKSRSKSSQEITLLQKQQEENPAHMLSVLPSNSPKLRKVSRSRSRSSSPTATGSDINIVIEDYDHQQPQAKTKKKEHIRVPIFVSLLIITLYVFGGALMFSMWEPWTYLEGSYFCFITLSTIGFGDYVPGSISRVDSADSRQKLIICCVYLMFGLSVLAMCFDLMQEDVRAKFLWLGMKMGLVDRRR